LGSSGLQVKLNPTQTFGIINENNQPVVSFDVLGNATLAGELNAASVTADDVTADQITASGATFSGTLYADRIVARLGDFETTRASTLGGGLTTAQVAEKAQRTGSKPVYGKMTMTLHTSYILVYVTNELLSDSPITLETLLPARFGKALAFEEDDLYLFGNGAAQPVGAMSSTANPALISQTAETGQIAATILAENIIKMWARCPPGSQKRAVWLVGNDSFPQLAQMHIKVGTGGIPIWVPGQNLAQAPNGLLFGRPVMISEKMQAVGTLGEIGDVINLSSPEEIRDFRAIRTGGTSGVLSVHFISRR